MPTLEIFRNDWKTFFEDFSRYHKGWTVTLNVFNLEFGAQEAIHEMVFEGLIAELQEDGKDSIEVLLGETAASHVSHTVARPTHVRLESEGATEVLQIESANQGTFLLNFHHASALEKISYGALQQSG
jgi:hypothetical protein